ncbi:MAG TPA: gliding motility-associated C-terminal domain-containing protein, partial [Cytophagaceae bacterium]
ATTTYYVSAVSVEGCESTVRTSVNAVVNTIQSAPIASDEERCGAGTVSFTANGSPSDYKWYDAATNGTLLGTGATFITPTISATTTYYVSAVSVEGCESAVRTSVNAVVNTIPSAPIASDEERCGVGTVSFTANGSPSDYKWYDAATNGNLLGTGTTFTTPTISATTTYYVSAVSVEGCESTVRTSVNAVVNSIPSAPIVSSEERCGAGTVSFTANGSPSDYKWYDAATNGNLLGTGTIFTTPTISATTTYYVSAISVEGCESSSRTSVNAVVNSIPSAPSASDVGRCGSGVVSLSANGSSDYKWYDAATNGNLLGTGTTFTTPTISATTTYYVSAVSAAGCESADRTELKAIVNDIPVAPVSSDVTICSNTTAQLSAISGSDNCLWYNAPVSGNIVGTGFSWETPVVASETTFYVSAVSAEGCESSRTAVTVFTMPSSDAGKLTADVNNVCVGTNSGVLTAVDFNGTIVNWLLYTNDILSNPTVINSTSDKLTFSDLVESTYYRVVVKNETCPHDTSAPFRIAVNPLSQPGIITMESNGDGTGKLHLSGYIGSIQYWEASTDNFNTVTVIPNTMDELTVNLAEGKKYRAIIQSGVCSSVESPVFNIPGFIVYTTFTPNNDGIDDIWVIEGIDAYADNTVKVFNRWGDLVYKESGYNNLDKAWDGSSNSGFLIGNMPLPEGSYFYQIETSSGVVISGYVILKR